MPPMPQSYSMFWTSGDGDDGGGGGGFPRTLVGALVQRAQEQNIPCGESLSST